MFRKTIIKLSYQIIDINTCFPKHIIKFTKRHFKRSLIFYIAIFTFKEISGFFHVIICFYFQSLFQPFIHTAFIHINKIILIFRVYSFRSLENQFSFKLTISKCSQIQKSSLSITYIQINKQQNIYTYKQKTNLESCQIKYDQSDAWVKLDMILNQTSVCEYNEFQFIRWKYKLIQCI
ncbi:hypothetical protein ABPG74_001411 [Tetrahymena malaccensis]